MIHFFTQLLDLIYKKKCYFCGSTASNKKMCDSCYDKVEMIDRKPIKYISSVPVYSASLYKTEMQKLIRGVKYHNQKELAIFQAKLMYDFWKELPFCDENFVIVPVPLYKKREKKRKYNQMMLVARALSEMIGYKVKDDLIYRIKETKPQYKLSMQERAQNMHNAFKVHSENYHNEKILIIDDILTTGSTLSEMIMVLQKENITNIVAFTTSCTEFHLS